MALLSEVHSTWSAESFFLSWTDRLWMTVGKDIWGGVSSLSAYNLILWTRLMRVNFLLSESYLEKRLSHVGLWLLFSVLTDKYIFYHFTLIWKIHHALLFLKLNISILKSYSQASLCLKLHEIRYQSRSIWVIKSTLSLREICIFIRN